MSKGKTTHLNDEQMKEAVTLFAQGLNRSEVVAHLIDADNNLQALEAEHGQPFRNNISNQLRSADPRSKHFATSKYKAHYDLHQQAALESLKARYNSCLHQSMDFLTKEIAMLTEQLGELNHMIDGAIDNEPQGTVEYIQTLNARNTTSKRVIELREKLLERIERITLPQPNAKEE